MMIQMAASNTILQTIVDEDKRGRVIFYAMAFFGTVPLGSLLAGAVAERIGAPDTILLGGVGCVVGAVFFMRALPELRSLARPIYVRRGLVPAPAESAADAGADAAPADATPVA